MCKEIYVYQEFKILFYDIRGISFTMKESNVNQWKKKFAIWQLHYEVSTSESALP